MKNSPQDSDQVLQKVCGRLPVGDMNRIGKKKRRIKSIVNFTLFYRFKLAYMNIKKKGYSKIFGGKTACNDINMQHL